MAEPSDFVQALRFFLPTFVSFLFRIFALGYNRQKSTKIVIGVYFAFLLSVPFVGVHTLGYYTFAKFAPLMSLLGILVILYISCDKPLPTLFVHFVQTNVVVLISIFCNTLRHLFTLNQLQVVLLMIAFYIPVFTFSYVFLRKPLRFMVENISKRWYVLICLPVATVISVLAVTVYSEYAFRDQFLYAGFVVCMIEFSFLTCIWILYANVRDFCNVSVLAQVDSMTGLYNRVIAEQLITQTLHKPQENRVYALIMMDIDNFKHINDTFGHAYGDMALQLLSKQIKSTFHHDVVLARFGGDEFCIFVNDIVSADYIFKRCNEFRKKIELLQLGETAVPFTVCMGIAVSANGDDSFDTLYKNADAALYASKKDGKNRVSLFSAI